MFRKIFVNFYPQHKPDNLFKVQVCNRNVKLSTTHPIPVSLRFSQSNNITSAPYRRYSSSSNDMNPKNTTSTNLDFNANISKPSIDSIIQCTTFKVRCLQKIVDILECSHEEASKLYKQYPFIFRECIDSSIYKISLLINANVPKRSILENVKILELEEKEIMCRIDEMNDWGLNDSQKGDFLATLSLNTRTFYSLSHIFKEEKNTVPFGNRLIYFSNLLRCSLPTMVKHAMKYDHLITNNFENIDAKFKTLLEIGISPESIANDTWWTVHRKEKFKMWQNTPRIQCDENDLCMIYFQKLVEREKNEKLILKPNQKRAEFLSEKLNVEMDIIKYLMATYPIVFNLDLNCAVKVIDFLYSEGYKGIQIVTSPSIMRRDVSFIKRRLIQMRSFGGRDPSIYVLNFNEVRYQRLIDRLTGS